MEIKIERRFITTEEDIIASMVTAASRMIARCEMREDDAEAFHELVKLTTAEMLNILHKEAL